MSDNPFDAMHKAVDEPDKCHYCGAQQPYHWNHCRRPAYESNVPVSIGRNQLPPQDRE